MADTSAKAMFGVGAREAAPFGLVVSPFAIVFGVFATEAGLNLAQTMAFSALVIAGASQMTAVQLMSENAPAVIVLATALAVNLRMAMYSASLAPYLGAAPVWRKALAAYVLVDQSYAMAISRFESEPDLPVAARMSYYLGTTAPVVPFWILGTYVGAVLGARIPAAWEVDFAVPIMFLAIVAPMVKTPAHLAAALTSIVLALVFAGFPFNTGLLVAALVAMVVGAVIETAMGRDAP